MSPSVAPSAEAPCQSRALMMRALLASSAVNPWVTNILNRLGVRSPLRRQRHLLRLRESLWVLVIHLISPYAPKPGGYQATTGARGITVRGTPSASVVRNTNASPHAT